jgi:excinuclease ABC subunit C
VRQNGVTQMSQAQSAKQPALPAASGKIAENAGVAAIRAALKTLPGAPGVYRMISADDQVLYVGKAKNLKKRVASYTNLNRQGLRIARMINRTRAMEFVTTHTEAEALLLEANLIKRLAPHYNILLRDDKSFPYILVTGDHDFPQVLKYRGARNRDGQFFGPFASAGAVNQSLAVLQRAFLLRTCTNAVFEARTRPCLLHQIKRCAAPCVGGAGADEYGELVDQARQFLTGKSKAIQERLAAQMQLASDNLEFEKAAILRDRIRAMTTIQARQDINSANVNEADLVALHSAGGQACIQVFFIRGGSNYGNRAYYPAHAADAEPEQIIEAFLGQFYTNKIPPRLVLLSHKLTEPVVMTAALTERAGRSVKIEVPTRGQKRAMIGLALVNAEQALGRRLVESASQRMLLEKLAERFELEGPPERIEVYDNSHISGTNAVGAMIVAGPGGMTKNAYRKYNIKNTSIEPGDDYAMMREVLGRRFARALEEDPERLRPGWPDLVLIDGGAGHLSVAAEVFSELGISDVPFGAISKGPDRDAGREQIHLPGRSAFRLDSRDPVLYFLQRLRDEAHRFAIGTHRSRRAKQIERSPLDEIQGVGGARKKALLHHFGSARAVSQAGLTDLEVVDGISKALAGRIYGWFHSDE